MKRNFTLIEVLISVMIVTISSIGLYSALLTAKKVSSASRIRLEAQRFSYDVAYKLLKTPILDLEDAVDAINNISGNDIKLNTDYKVDSDLTSTTDKTNLTVDLRKAGKDTSTGATLTVEVWDEDYAGGSSYTPDYTKGLLRINVTVRWYRTDGVELGYTSTLYRYPQSE